MNKIKVFYQKETLENDEEYDVFSNKLELDESETGELALDIVLGIIKSSKTVSSLLKNKDRLEFLIEINKKP